MSENLNNMSCGVVAFGKGKVGGFALFDSFIKEELSEVNTNNSYGTYYIGIWWLFLYQSLLANVVNPDVFNDEAIPNS